MKTAIVIALVLVLVALGSAGLFMLRKGDTPQGRDARMARALAWRVALSVAVFLFILLGWRMGWIHPTGLPTGR
jgi:TRAP-type C4-dicarboxylate transport system permease large subunit